MTRHNIFIGAIILLFIGALAFYFGASRQVKSENHSKTESSHNDSIINIYPETMPDMGTKPEKNPKDGSIKIVADFVKSNSKNPTSFEFLEWSEVSVEGGYWKVRCKYRGISSFNAEVTTSAWFYIRNQKVVHTKIISKI